MEDKKGYSARELAVLSLCRLEREGKYGSLEADAAIKKFGLDTLKKKKSGNGKWTRPRLSREQGEDKWLILLK